MSSPIDPEFLQSEIERRCFRPPIPEIDVAAGFLSDAVNAHLQNHCDRAEELIRMANMPKIREWVESIWGKASPYVKYRSVSNAPVTLRNAQRVELRMPSSAQKQLLIQRDGYHCRFCGIPVVRKEIRRRLHNFYPSALPWGHTNSSQHAAFQAMWAQYDHIVPHARGGGNELDNVVITCAPCNFGRMQYVLDEVGVADPRIREPIRSDWDGLERLLLQPTAMKNLS